MFAISVSDPILVPSYYSVSTQYVVRYGMRQRMECLHGKRQHTGTPHIKWYGMVWWTMITYNCFPKNTLFPPIIPFIFNRVDKMAIRLKIKGQYYPCN